MRRERPLVTIAIPFYNAAFTLPAAIESALAQPLEDFELLLVDDGSEDRADVLILPFLGDGRVSLLRHRRRCGLARRLNQVAALARGKYLARMDADDIMAPSRIATQVRFLEQAPEVDLLGSGVYLIDREDGLIGKKSTSRTRICRGVSFLSLFHPTVTGRTAWFRRHPYSEDFPRCEDFELWLRTGGGDNMTHLPEPLLFYRIYLDRRRPETLETLRQCERVLRSSARPICRSCLLGWVLRLRLKILFYRVAGGTPLLGTLAALRASPITAGERRAAEQWLDRIRTRARARLAADLPRMLRAVAAEAATRSCGIEAQDAGGQR